MKPTARATWTCMCSFPLLLLLWASLANTPAAAAPAAADPRGTVIASFARGSGPRQLGITEHTEDAPAVGPTGLVDTENGDVLILDSVNARILRVDPAGKSELAAPLRPDSLPQDILRQGSAVYVLEDKPVYAGSDTGKGRLSNNAARELTGPSESTASALFEANGAVLSAPGGTPERTGGEAGAGRWLRGTSSDATPLEYRTVRTDTGAVRMDVRGSRLPGMATLSIPIPAALLGSTALLGTDMEGRFHVRAEQFAQRQGRGRAKVWVLRYKRDGSFDGGYDVPDETLELVPNRYLALSRTGMLYFMESHPKRTRLWSLKPFGAADFARRQEATMRRIAAAQGPVAAGGGAPSPSGAQEAATTGLTRARILETAEAYRTASWTVSQANYRPSAVSRCDPPRGLRWKRPAYLEGRQGERVSGIPYNWGGYMTIAEFMTKVARGDGGGNICTCRTGNCVDSKAAGVDCSGFVSKTWETRRYSTSSLAKATRQLASYAELKPGDALNKAGSHVRLFVSPSPAGNGSIRAYEASTSCGRVCLRDFTTRQLQGYVALAAPVKE